VVRHCMAARVVRHGKEIQATGVNAEVMQELVVHVSREEDHAVKKASIAD